ncbi:MAG TPA: hypothetical protein VJR03_09265 [Nitrospira sp.]|nr:hypothetical protein [Nitrospira sp.]
MVAMAAAATIMDLPDSIMLIGRGDDGSSKMCGETIVARPVILPKASRESMSHQGTLGVALTCSEIACYGFLRSCPTKEFPAAGLFAELAEGLEFPDYFGQN